MNRRQSLRIADHESVLKLVGRSGEAKSGLTGCLWSIMELSESNVSGPRRLERGLRRMAFRKQSPSIY